jgi:hypothetical protein
MGKDAAFMKIAIATKDWITVSGHAGQARNWLLYELSGLAPGAPLPEPERIVLAKEEVLHHFQDDGPHPLDGVEIVIAGSAGDGFVRHMKKRGAEVLLTGRSVSAPSWLRPNTGRVRGTPVRWG